MGAPVEEIVRVGARLSVYDAAFYVSRERYRLSKHDLEAFMGPLPKTDGSRLKADIRRYAREKLGAPNTPTFRLMKLAHPAIKDEDLTRAIRAANKLSADCKRYFATRSLKYLDNVERAITEARKHNPGFGDDTYRAARDNFISDMM